MIELKSDSLKDTFFYSIEKISKGFQGFSRENRTFSECLHSTSLRQGHILDSFQCEEYILYCTKSLKTHKFVKHNYLH